jgi:group I intron endonuclease
METEKEAVVYWLHLENHCDPFNEGYIGVTTNFDKRMKSHKNTPVNNHMANAIAKYEWDNIVASILHTGSESECYSIENSYRNIFNIGWNQIPGGSSGGGGSLGFKHSQETIEVRSKLALQQHKNNPELGKQLAEYNSTSKAKSYLITYPSGTQVTITNMRRFCRENYLSQSCMTQVAAGKYSQHKGYKVKPV